MASNLPPGVSDSMIPGNGPEDEAYERRAEAIHEALTGMGLTEDQIDQIIERLDPVFESFMSESFAQGAENENMDRTSRAVDWEPECRHPGSHIDQPSSS